MMLFVLLTTLAATTMIQMHQTSMKREREVELLFIGDQYRKAISSYYNAIPQGTSRQQPPRTIDDLLNDQRFPTPIQHLRRAYPDPMTGKNDWQLIQEAGGIVGVSSRSTEAPLKRSGFPILYSNFADQTTYNGWVFRIKI